MIPYGRQDITDEDIDAVVAVLRSDFLTQGPIVPKFQQAVATRCSAAHAVSANSATSALHVACLALGLGEGDWLWTSPITFVASANCGLYCGAKVDFVDIDPRTYNMCPAALARKLEIAKQFGHLPKIVVPVHFAGQSCDMAAIHQLGQQYGFSIVEDASHAIGGTYQAAPVGNCRYSDITIFSFHPVKIITTAEGGMATTNSAELADRMARLASHGVTRNPTLMSKEPEGDWYYEQTELGLNYRMTELHGALGLSQIARLDDYIERRHEIARRYDKELETLPLVRPFQSPASHSALHLYPIWLDPERLDRKKVFDALRRDGINVNVHYVPVYRQPYYQSMSFSVSDFPKAERYYGGAVTIPIYPTMTDSQQNQIVSALRRALQ